jgi:hypothetical protein
MTSSLDLGRSELLASPLSTGSTDEAAVDHPRYFCWETPAQYISIIQNDWPYSGRDAKTMIEIVY